MGLRLLVTADLCPLAGEILLLREGDIVGTIGVSGAQSDQDVQVATAGAQVVKS